MHLVGRILPALLLRPETNNRQAAVEEAIWLADLTLDAMGWSTGKPHWQER